jgi:hypothetical protein
MDTSPDHYFNFPAVYSGSGVVVGVVLNEGYFDIRQMERYCACIFNYL